MEHDYDYIVEPAYKQYGDQMVYKYLVLERLAETVTIYNLDHSIYKTVNLTIPKDMLLDGSSVYPLYTNVINEDPLLEFYYYVSNNGIHDSYIMNEDGVLIEILKGAIELTVRPTESGFKLFTFNTNKVYSLPTTPSTNLSLPAIQEANLPYPNPASQVITIPYQLSGQWGTVSIYMASGQLVEQKNVDNKFKSLLLDVSGYAKGMYYYKVGKQSGEFMVN